MKNITYIPSLLVSNIFDPCIKTPEDSMELYRKLKAQGHYTSIETRLVEGEDFIQAFLDLKPEWRITYWTTGQLGRAGLNLSDLCEENRIKAVEKVKEMITTSTRTHGEFIGLASGKMVDGKREDGLCQFEKSLKELLCYIQEKGYPTKLLVEPLDAFAHKKNVLGDTKTTLKFLSRFDKSVFQNQRLSISWDSAHVALNKDDFKESIQVLAPYISRVHFANAILDETNPRFGDWHIDLCEEGFLNQQVARDILEALDEVSSGEILVTMEIRESDKEKVWALEDKCYHFLQDVIQ